jgi:uncharacterized membrane protein
MSYWKAFGLVIFAAVCLIGGTAGSAHAQCSFAAVCATEWSSGSVVSLGGLPGFTSSEADGISGTGLVVGDSVVGGVNYATEWNSGSVINLGGLPGSTENLALGVNDAGQAVGSQHSRLRCPVRHRV